MSSTRRAGIIIAIFLFEIIWNAGWNRTLSQGSPATQQGDAEASAGSPEDQAVLDALDQVAKHDDIAWMPLNHAIEAVYVKNGLNLYVNWNALSSVGVDKKMLVVVSGGTEKLSQLLDDLISATHCDKLGYVVIDGVVVISTRGDIADMQRRGEPYLRPLSSPGLAMTRLDHVLPRVQLPNVPLSECIKFVRDLWGLDIRVRWPILEAAGISRQAPINLDYHDMKISTLLDFLLDEAGDGKLGYVARGGTVTISTIDDLRTTMRPPSTQP
jgi:hypothetical protein